METILQALAHLDHAEHDAGHDLEQWLQKCSPVLQETIKRDAQAAWNRLRVSWRNNLRYQSIDQWLGGARKTPDWRKLRGSDYVR